MVLRLVGELTGVPASGKTADGQAPGRALTAQQVADIAASFQRVVVSVLLDRTFEAARWLGARSVGISGGVSANSRLRADADARAIQDGIPVFVPPLALSTDNAAMIGAAAMRLIERGSPRSEYAFNADPALTL